MENIKEALEHLDRSLSEGDQLSPIPFEDFLKQLTDRPYYILRNVFQVFYDMIKTYVEEEQPDAYDNDPESVRFTHYDCRKLFVDESDHPFFADRLFANRFINHVEALKRGAQQNRIYIFDGPPGCGKSTFLNNLLMKFEEYTNTEEGSRYEVIWRLDRRVLGGGESEAAPLLEKLAGILESNASREPSALKETGIQETEDVFDAETSPYLTENYIEVPCPSHDHPVLMIPKKNRRSFLDDLFLNDEFKWNMFTEKEYDWIFRENPCTICGSIYEALLQKLRNPLKVFSMIYARPYRFNRRLGDGISVFNPGDKPLRQNIFTNAMLQRRINMLLKDSNRVKYIFSRYAKTNNGIYALMDIKSHNTERLIELHNIISEGLHKVEDIEENVNSLFLALMNPEDKKNIQEFQSFSDRIEYIHIPYVLDLNTEVEIYRDIFGKHIDRSFLPRVLHNFSRVVISSRIDIKSDALLEWIGDPGKYKLYCDENLQLLKMEIYTGYIPPWLSQEDRKRFTSKRRRAVLGESQREGTKGLSGRDAIKIFNEFYSTYAREDRLINMSDLCLYFTRVRKDLNRLLPEGFLESLLRMYDYTVLQEVKESLYYYNEERISRDIQNYMFAVNFEIGAVAACQFTGEHLEITEDFLSSIESRLIGAASTNLEKLLFRTDVQKEYASKTLTQEMLLEGSPITQTSLYQFLHDRYVHNLKEKVLEPFIDNENFRQAVKDFGEEAFKTYDKRIRDDVTFLINNLCNKCLYTQQGAKEVCMYVIDNDLAKKFT